MVNYYSFIVPPNSDSETYGIAFINYLNTIISDSFVEEKILLDTRPEWAFGGNSNEAVFLAGLNFKYKGTEFVISASRATSNTTVYIYIYARNNRVTLSYTTTNTITNNLSNAQILNYLVGQNNDYFVISNYYNIYYNTFLVIKIDTPVNPADTVYVSILNQSQGTYNVSFDNEDVNNTPVRFVIGTQIDYLNSFINNYYNKKTELNHIYAYTTQYGVRGKISNLVSLTRFRTTNVGTFYYINGVEYAGLNSLKDIISTNYTGILLKSY